MENKVLENIYVLIQNVEKHEKRILRRRKEKERKKAARRYEESINESRRLADARKIFNECKRERIRKRVRITFREEVGTYGGC